MNTTDRILGEAMTPYQKRIYKDPWKAVGWAIKHKQRFPEAEPYIRGVDKTLPQKHSLQCQDAVDYARDVIGGRWPEAEEAIAKNPISAYYYARGVIKGRWPEGEPAIAKDPFSAYDYARDVIGGRWPEAEPVIATSPYFAYKYAKNVIGGRWPEAEEAIAKSPGHTGRVDLYKQREEYLSTFPDAKLSWAMKGWLDWEQAWL